MSDILSLPQTVVSQQGSKYYLLAAVGKEVLFEHHISRTAPPNSAYKYVHRCSVAAWINKTPFLKEV